MKKESRCRNSLEKNFRFDNAKVGFFFQSTKFFCDFFEKFLVVFKFFVILHPVSNPFGEEMLTIGLI